MRKSQLAKFLLLQMNEESQIYTERNVNLPSATHQLVIPHHTCVALRIWPESTTCFVHLKHEKKGGKKQNKKPQNKQTNNNNKKEDPCTDVLQSPVLGDKLQPCY